LHLKGSEARMHSNYTEFYDNLSLIVFLELHWIFWQFKSLSIFLFLSTFIADAGPYSCNSTRGTIMSSWLDFFTTSQDELKAIEDPLQSIFPTDLSTYINFHLQSQFLLLVWTNRIIICNAVNAHAKTKAKAYVNGCEVHRKIHTRTVRTKDRF
jgi:hypothetical protein